MSAIEELERKILELEAKIADKEDQEVQLLTRCEKALDIAMHAYKVDHYGYIWVWEWKTKKYVRSSMRVMTPEIADKFIKTRHLADGAVTSEKIADRVVTSEKLGDESVTADKIENRAVKSRHIDDKAIQSRHIDDKQVKSRHIARGAVDISKIAPGTLDGREIVMNSNLIAIDTEDDGTIVAYYGGSESISIEMAPDGTLYLVYSDVRNPESEEMPLKDYVFEKISEYMATEDWIDDLTDEEVDELLDGAS